MRMKQFVTSVILVFTILSLSMIKVDASSGDVQQQTIGEKQYYKLCVEDDIVFLQSVSAETFNAVMRTRAAWYAEGWEIVSLSGTTAGYVTIHYQTVSSAGKKVFDLSTAYFEVNPLNGYALGLEYLSSTVHCLNMKCNFANLLGDSGYRTHQFYPQQ